MRFASSARELRRDALTMLKTHIVLIFMLCLALLLMLYLNFLMDLTITHIVWVHERTALCLDALDMTHVLIVVIVSCVGLVFLLELLTLTLSQDTCTVHVFPVVVHAPLGQMVKCKEL
jgi:multisubunit Na+/H+ antiporter MnhB subunit